MPKRTEELNPKRVEWLQNLMVRIKQRHGITSNTDLEPLLLKSAQTIGTWVNGRQDPDGLGRRDWQRLAAAIGVSETDLYIEADQFVEGDRPKSKAPDEVPGACEMVQRLINQVQELEVGLRVVQAHVSQSHRDVQVKNSGLISADLIVSSDTSFCRSLDDLATEQIRRIIEQACDAQGIYQEEFLEIAQSQSDARQEIAFSLKMGLPLSGDQLGAIAYGLQMLGYRYDAGELARIQNDSTNQHC